MIAFSIATEAKSASMMANIRVAKRSCHMSRTVTATEAKNRLGALLEAVAEHQDEVIVESHGRARAVIVPVVAYEELTALRDRKRRQDAVSSLRRLREQVRARNEDLSDEEALAIADEISHAAVDRMAERGEIVFERDKR
ncbi:MAG TPA: type II toxin-antitoxin system Phd/YefM family antitoxin [Thermomicrobiales bacterium]|nr:type II toxin-antitoxin system Phd/YefM family antitoxin [Thermomicrobiales bacterium]